MKKVLMLATTAAMIEQFNKNNILILEEMGYEVHVAGNWDEGNPISDERLEKFKEWIVEHKGMYFHIPAIRKPTALKNNLCAYKKVIELIHENQYEFIHCHTPIGSVIGRLAAHRTNTKIIYTAHGFHFYKGAPLVNWLIYYPVEWFLSRWTDILITINREDYNRAKKSFHAKRTEYIPGVGIDVYKYATCAVDRSVLRQKFEIQKDDFVIVSVGEVNSNKNHEVIIRAIAKLNQPNLKYIICGRGPLQEELKRLSRQIGLDEKIYILGYCDNINEYLHLADAFAFPSKREGLGLAALEAMAAGLPLITSNIHGIKDYSINEVTGFSYFPNDVDGFATGINKLMLSKDLRLQMKERNIEFAKKYEVKNINFLMCKIYSCAINE